MNRFSDGRGGRWEVIIDPPRAEAVRRSLGLVLPALLDDDMRPLAALLDDPPMLAAVLYQLCPARPGATPEEFALALADPLTAEEAAAAFCQALLDAYRPGGALRVRHTPRRDRALAALIDRATPTGFDTTPPQFRRPKEG